MLVLVVSLAERGPDCAEVKMEDNLTSNGQGVDIALGKGGSKWIFKVIPREVLWVTNVSGFHMLPEI